jgi:lysozyme
MTRAAMFAAVRPFAPGGRFTPEMVKAGDAFADALGLPREEARPFDGKITARIAAELLAHEAIVLEAYLDSVKVWTWGVGVTNASGHDVYPRYKDNPQTVEKALEVYLWLLRTKYAPAVVEAFDGFPLTEEQYAASLSFHYNTGAIGRASWVKSVKAGKTELARAEFMQWRRPAEIIPRRRAECALFFDGKWSADGTTTIWPVRKPSYSPDWSKGRKVNVMADLEKALAS